MNHLWFDNRKQKINFLFNLKLFLFYLFLYTFNLKLLQFILDEFASKFLWDVMVLSGAHSATDRRTQDRGSPGQSGGAISTVAHQNCDGMSPDYP